MKFQMYEYFIGTYDEEVYLNVDDFKLFSRLVNALHEWAFAFYEKNWFWSTLRVRLVDAYDDKQVLDVNVPSFVVGANQVIKDYYLKAALYFPYPPTHFSTSASNNVYNFLTDRIIQVL